MDFVELRCKSNFSFLEPIHRMPTTALGRVFSDRPLRGASHPDELAERALDSGLAGMALTDINGVYGMPRAYKAIRDRRALNEEAARDFKFICGSELTFLDHPNLTVLAKSRKAYGALCRLITHAKEGEEKGQSHLTLEGMQQFLTAEECTQLVILPRGLENLKIDWLKEMFGKNLYLPLTFYLDGRDRERVQKIRKLSHQFDIRLVGSQDVEYHIKQRKILQDVLISAHETESLETAGFKLASNAERYFKSPQEMALLFKDFPEALPQSLKIADECTFCPSELRYRYPSEWIPTNHSAQSYLQELVKKNAPWRYKNGVPDRVRQQVLHELKLIEKLQFADYFLTIYDIVEFAKSRGILCQGRGSAANSVICYILGITAIDPVQMDLLFERFISLERGEPPDIDIDFEHERREEVIQYIYEKYGRHRAAMVSAVVTYQHRSAFREVCKAFGLHVGTLSAKKVEQQFQELIAERAEPEKLREKIDAMADEIKGFPRHLSIHSGGFTLSADPITEIVPVESARMDGRTIIQWDKYDLDTLGLLKVDILSLGMLSCLSKVLKNVNMQFHEIPHDDQKTYEMIRRAETVGTFQIESRAQMSMLGRLQPRNFYDLVIEVAIVRPGPIVGKMVHPYLKRRRGIERVSFPNQIVKRILGRTLGIPLFQEQVMKLAIELAGFSPGEADKLRKCINAWKTSAPIAQLAERLKNGLIQGGMSSAFADQIFDQIQGFSHYGFPESHAASFALIAYASCYLKAHHPGEFACALINSQPMGFYRPDTILYEALRNGVKVLPISVLTSDWDCKMEGDNTIRLGFRMIHGLAKRDVEHLQLERLQSPFVSLADFLKRSTIRRDVLSRLALACRFEDFNWGARESLWALLEYQNLFKKDQSSQMSFFRDTNILDLQEPEQISKSQGAGFKDLNNFEKIQNDYRAFSMSMHGHPMQELRSMKSQIPKTTSKTIRTLSHNSTASFAGLVLIRQRPPTANGTCFATLEDEHGFVDLVLWRDIYDKYRSVFLNHCFITVRGTVQKDKNTVNFIVKKIEAIVESDLLDGQYI